MFKRLETELESRAFEGLHQTDIRRSHTVLNFGCGLGMYTLQSVHELLDSLLISTTALMPPAEGLLYIFKTGICAYTESPVIILHFCAYFFLKKIWRPLMSLTAFGHETIAKRMFVIICLGKLVRITGALFT